MKIRQRNNGQWCMEHNGVEAPYLVTRNYPIRSFNVIALGDGDEDKPEVVVNSATKEEAERATLKHYEAS